MAKKNFRDLTEREILALAIQLEEEDSRVYGDFADGLRESYPATAKAFDEMQAEESRHRQMLLDMYKQRFGDHIPLIRRQDVKGFVERRPIWLVRPLGINVVRKQVREMELETLRFYDRAMKKVSDASTRKLLGDLADVERQHSEFAETLRERQIASGERGEEDKASQRMFMLQVVQPGLSGLIDGSISTLAPIFAAAFATHKSRDAFLVGLAASLGAGISMAFTEALSDDGSLTGRGTPVFRGSVTGTDDGDRRVRPHAAVPNWKLSRCDSRGHDRGGHRADRDQLRSPPLYGHAALVVGGTGDCWRGAGFRCGNLDREFLACATRRLLLCRRGR